MTVDVPGGGSGASSLGWRVAEAVSGLARFAADSDIDADLDRVLRQLCTVAVDVLRSDGVGVMSFDGTRSRFVRASNPDVIPMEELQEQLQAGPCREAMTQQTTATAADADDIAAQWPDFVEVARHHHIQAVMAVPLNGRGGCWGALDVYWPSPHRLDLAEHSAAQLLADAAVSYLVMARDRSQARDAHRESSHRAMHDQLTELPNRGLIHELLAHALDTARRHHSAVAVLFIDLDRFKAINDTHGHRAGDAVLVQTARRLQRVVRSSDSVGRLSGDEFIVVCEDLPADPDEIAARIRTLAGRIATAVGATVHVGGIDVTVTASIGTAVATYPDESGSATGSAAASRLIHRADQAMYDAKHRRNGAPR